MSDSSVQPESKFAPPTPSVRIIGYGAASPGQPMPDYIEIARPFRIHGRTSAAAQYLGARILPTGGGAAIDIPDSNFTRTGRTWYLDVTTSNGTRDNEYVLQVILHDGTDALAVTERVVKFIDPGLSA